MQVAALLSDLKSLTVCTHGAALKLVSVHEVLQQDKERTGSSTSAVDTTQSNKDNDEDLERANELCILHQDVKMRHIQHGFDKELVEARENVQKVLASLNQSR